MLLNVFHFFVLNYILGLTETLMVFSEGKEDLEWGEMAKMAFDILLCCAEKAIQDMEICTMATAKLHALVSLLKKKKLKIGI